MQHSESFGKYISRNRKNLGMTQEQLADKVGVSKSAIAKWETDGGLPDRDNLKRLAKCLNMTLELLHAVIENDRGRYTASLGTNPNITPDVIAALEAHGYTVIGPNEKIDR